MNDDGDTLPSAGGEVYLSIRALQTQVVEGTSETTRTPVSFEITRSGDLNQVTHFGISFPTGWKHGESPDVITGTNDGISGSFSPLFEIGESSYVFTRYLQADDYNEPDEYLTARLTAKSDSPNAVVLTDIARVLVLNDDGPTVPRITADAGITEETDGTSTAHVRVELAHTTSVDVSMEYTIGGPGVGTDYAGGTGILTIPAGQLYADLAVQVFGDDVAEPFKHIEIELENPINGFFGHSNIDSWDTGLVIVDDDLAGGFFPDAATLAANAIDLGVIEKYGLIDHYFELSGSEDVLAYRIETQEAIAIDGDGSKPILIFDGSGNLLHAKLAGFDYVDFSEHRTFADGYVFSPGEYYFVYSGSYSPIGIPQTRRDTWRSISWRAPDGGNAFLHIRKRERSVPRRIN